MSEVTRALLRNLALANHHCEGLCPDQIEGADSRDPNCFACQVLDEVAALLSDLEPPSREGKVKVVVRGYVASDGRAVGEASTPDADGERAAWFSARENAELYGIAGGRAWTAELWVTPPAIEVVEDVEVLDE